MDDLAHQRRQRHEELISDLSGKIKKIHKDKMVDPAAKNVRTRDYFEAQLMEIEKADVSEFVHLMREFPDPEGPTNFAHSPAPSAYGGNHDRSPVLTR